MKKARRPRQQSKRPSLSRVGAGGEAGVVAGGDRRLEAAGAVAQGAIGALGRLRRPDGLDRVAGAVGSAQVAHRIRIVLAGFAESGDLGEGLGAAGVVEERRVGRGDRPAQVVERGEVAMIGRLAVAGRHAAKLDGGLVEGARIGHQPVVERLPLGDLGGEGVVARADRRCGGHQHRARHEHGRQGEHDRPARDMRADPVDRLNPAHHCRPFDL
jgi:hypothetical protein